MKKLLIDTNIMLDLLARRIPFYDEAAGEAASAEFVRVFKERSLPSEIPDVRIEPDALNADGEIGLLTLLVTAGMASSNGEARRLVQQGAVKLDDAPVRDPQLHLALPAESILQCGKRRFARIVSG